ncbi:MAG: nucleotidyltransferase family protein [Rhodocyclaceae bacterium]|nr:nucleotidyltransferase family protein [Rhodocyclaceae bacterium]
MNQASLPLQALLLDLISVARPLGADDLRELDDADWDALLDMARRHRLEPLLHWRLTHERAALPLPARVRELLAARFKFYTLRALGQQRELLLAGRVLEQAGIPYVALKGAGLATQVYPHPALRPMRDVDFLVPEEDVLRAYQALQDSGLERMPEFPGDPAAALSTEHQLPSLRFPAGGGVLEIHCRLFHRTQGAEHDDDLSADPLFWQRVRPLQVAGRAVPCESPTDLLLHLIVHAVYNHKFDNGPLLLSDLALLLAREQIDWPLFWQLAARGQHTRGCVLGLKLAEHYWGSSNIVWPDGGAIGLPLLEQAALLMLRDSALRKDVLAAQNLAGRRSVRARLALLLQRAFPPRRRLASFYPVAADSPRIYLFYPLNWWRLATRRLPAYIASLRDTQIQSEAHQVGELNDWLYAD